MKRIFLLMLTLMAGAGIAFGQAISVNGGSIAGTITDPTGSAVPNASILVTKPDSGYSKILTSDGAGFYSIGPLIPGSYTVKVTAPGFETLDVNTVVRTGTATSGTFKLTLGKSSETIEVNAGAVQVNTDQIQVSDIITQNQIDTLPVNGRNFLDVAQIAPGVILQQGSTFDPTKTGYSAISVSGVGGRTTRILLDGQDISDEFVGTTIFNVSEGSISEFQLNRSTQDVSGEVTSTGQVLVATRSGTNAYHGMGFYNFQDARAGFAAQAAGKPNTATPFQRNQYGGSVGGPIFKDKLFFFANLERVQQAQGAAAGVGSSFTNTTGASNPSYSSPFKDTYTAGRLDYTGPFGGHYFFRGNDNFNGAIGNSGRNYQLFTNRDNTWGLAGGADFASGHLTHSFRGSYEKFHNFIGDATAGNASIYDPIPSLTIYYATQTIWTGPNPNAPQGTFQSDKQARYDGTYTRGAHIFKFGSSVNRIQSAAFAAFYGLAPRATLGDTALLSGTATSQNPLGLGCKGVAGAAACPGDLINGYNTISTVFGNNQGFGTTQAGFGLPGGAGNAWRAAGYLGDSYKVTPNMTVTAGIRYSVDTNRENNDLAPPTCADLSTKFTATASTNPCASAAATTSLFALYNPSFTGSVRQPYGNFSPQIGLNYSPGDHKTSYRAGFGLFFESVVFNNTDNARGNLLKFSQAYSPISTMCSVGTLTFPDGTVYKSIDQSTQTLKTDTSGTALTALCLNQTVSQSAPAFVAIAKAYQNVTKANPNVASSGYVGTTLSASGLYAPNYHTPYSEQWNFGVQREVLKGAVLSVDYVHNTTLKIGQTNDINHLGAARNFNLANATTAITTTLAQCGTGATVATASQTGGCLGLHKNGQPVQISDFAKNGLDSQATYVGASPYVYAGKPNAGAFPGNNPLLGNGGFIQPIGRSGYDALQVVFRGQRNHPLPFVERGNAQATYNYSRIVSSAGGGTSDQFFSNGTTDKDNPSQFIGRSALDRTQQVNIAGSLTFKYGPQMGIIAHFYTAPPSTLTLEAPLSNGNIFQSDITGDGTTGDVAPGTVPGGYEHDINGSSLQSYVTNFNATQAGKLTPAGQAVVNSGLITYQQMLAIGGTVQRIADLPQSNALNNPTYRNMDVNLSYPIALKRFREGLTLEPSIAFYNIGNFSNFGGAPTFTAVVNGTLTNSITAQAANGIAIPAPLAAATNNNTSTVTGQSGFGVLSARRTSRGTGTFDQGAPRSTEFGLKLNF